jgi:hypothetical protein
MVQRDPCPISKPEEQSVDCPMARCSVKAAKQRLVPRWPGGTGGQLTGPTQNVNRDVLFNKIISQILQYFEWASEPDRHNHKQSVLLRIRWKNYSGDPVTWLAKGGKISKRSRLFVNRDQ